MVKAGEWQAGVMTVPLRNMPAFPGIEVHGEEGLLVGALVNALKHQGYKEVRPVIGLLETPQHSRHDLEVWIGNPV
jgi:hypothetical protein